ncbi:prothymosin alpha-like [Mus pahari]|uniref:prothymosin alpha-like n=1 Tax=Mus pahari TaxID=10093 RepID=UPI000A30F110|nr:prothymosin alpha-like [Mus pahari]
MSDAAMDTSSEITTKDLKEKKVVEEVKKGRDAPASQNEGTLKMIAEADNEVGEKEGEGGEEEEEEGDGEEEVGDEDEEAEAPTGKRITEGDEDGVDSKKQKTDEDD